jgi:hypothetical protein
MTALAPNQRSEPVGGEEGNPEKRPVLLPSITGSASGDQPIVPVGGPRVQADGVDVVDSGVITDEPLVAGAALEAVPGEDPLPLSVPCGAPRRVPTHVDLIASGYELWSERRPKRIITA